MYQIKEISATEHDGFLNNHAKEHFMQTSAWGQIKMMNGRWQMIILGLFNNTELVASTMLLKRKIPVLNSYIFYAPRGYIIDFDNQELLKIFTQKLKEYIKRQKACYLMIDPDIYYRKMLGDGEVIVEKLAFIDMMKALGYKHNGFNMNFETGQPRFTFRLDLKQDKDKIFNGFSKIIRTNMKNSSNYVKCEKSHNIDVFYHIMQDTAKRDGFIEASKEHYEHIFNLLNQHNMATLYVATYYPNLHNAFLVGKLAELDAEKVKLNNKLTSNPNDTKSVNRLAQIAQQSAKTAKTLDEVHRALDKYPQGIALAAGITINTEHRAWLVYGGNLSLYRDVCANYAIKQYEIFDDIDKGYEFVDFFGTIGNPTPDNPLFGIHDFKRKFGGDYIEFPGEFHLVVRPLSYLIWIKLYPFALNLLRKLEIKKRQAK